MIPRSPRHRAVLAGLALLTLLVVAGIVDQCVATPAGDYATRRGDILLADSQWDEAIVWFDQALTAQPAHRGALMGRAIALLQSGRIAEAEAAFDRLIALLSATPAGDDATGRGALASAYANRGILFDRTDRPEQALADYRAALAIDAEAVEGPGLGHRILFANARPSSVAKRALYLEQQLALPPEQRRLRDPERDARQRMHKP